MSFVVRMKKRKRMVFVRALCILMIAVIMWVINWEPMRETLAKENAYIFFWGMVGVFLLIFALSFYAQRRPRIEVDGQDITFYPKWAPSKQAFLSEITSRKEKPDYYDPKQAAVAGALGGGLLAYAVTKRNASTMAAPKAMIYTYYSGDTKLITVSTREMENVERFDLMVVSKLEGKTLAAELEPRAKRKSPLLVAGLIGIVCVLVVCAVLFSLPDKETGDFLPPVTSADPGLEQKELTSKVTYSTQGVAFEVSAEWTQAEGTDLFYTANGSQVYGLNGVSALGSYTPQDFFEELVDYYQTSNQFTTLDVPDALTSWQSSDGVECQIADLTG